MLDSLAALGPRPEQAVIINVGTRLPTTLAVLSTLRHADLPLLVIDCESRDGSVEHLRALQEEHGFDLLSAPLRPHGLTLDWLFAEIPADVVLLVDSDLELLRSDIVPTMRSFLADDRVFGAGFVHGPTWLSTHPDIGWYEERPWIPLTMLRTAHVRQALAAGRSFRDRTAYNDVAVSPRLSRLLALRFRFGRTRQWRLRGLDWAKGRHRGQRPCYVYLDTGADVFLHLRYDLGYLFAGHPAELSAPWASHFHGVTRLLLDPSDRHGTDLADALAVIDRRLADEYGYVDSPTISS